MMRLAAVVAALGSVGFSVVRDPNVLAPIRWPTSSVTVVLHADGSDDVTDGSDLTAIRYAMAAWTSVSCSSLTFVDGGTTTQRAAGNDGQNRIFFLEDTWPGAASDATAYTQMVVNATPEPDVWLDADVMLNGRDYLWAANGDTRAYDIQHAATHELGHVLGLRHDSTPESTMYWASRRGRTGHRTLHDDDVAAACFLYPSSSFSCAGDGDCPLYNNANGGTAVRSVCGSGGACVAGTASFGEDCFTGADCASGNCQRLDGAPGTEVGFCTTPCDPEPCPSGARCGTFGGDELCAPGYDDCVTTEDCATTNVVCEQDLDGRFHCMRLCLSDANCVGDLVCHGGTGMQPASYCRLPGAGAEGDPCSDGFDCASLVCGSDGGGVPRCVGNAILPPDPPADGGPVDDGGAPPGDADGQGGDGGGGDPNWGDPIVGDASFGDGPLVTPADDDLADKRVAGGCAAASPGLVGLLLAVGILGLRRRSLDGVRRGE